MEQEQEIWKDIPNYEGYQCSTFGRIKSFKQKKYPKGKILSTHLCGNGYYLVFLNKYNKHYSFYTYILVAITHLNYIKTSRKICINHIDGDRKNNKVYNLEIVTQSYNVKDGFNRGRVIHNKGKYGKDTLNYKMVYRYDKNMNYIDCFYGAKEASRILNIPASSITVNIKWKTKLCINCIFSHNPPKNMFYNI